MDIREKLTNSVLAALNELEQMRSILEREVVSGAESYQLDADHASSLMATLEDTIDQVNTLKGRV